MPMHHLWFQKDSKNSTRERPEELDLERFHEKTMHFNHKFSIIIEGKHYTQTWHPLIMSQNFLQF